MNGEANARDHARRNRMIAIAAGAITVTAIVVAFAAEYFELPWKWLRPGVELLLLAELVGLVVLERHQLFEPVQESVRGIETQIAEIRDALALTKMDDIRQILARLSERISEEGQAIVYAGPAEVV